MQHEQEINARYARIEGIGDYCSMRELSRQRIIDFLDRRFAATRPANGVDQALGDCRLRGLTFLSFARGRCDA